MSIWNQDRVRTPRRHTLGLWLSTGKLASRAFVPSAKDRKPLLGLRPFWQVFGGQTGDVTIPANQWVELRQVCQSDFIAHSIMISTTVGGTSANPGVRAQIRDMSTMPGKGSKFSISGVNDVNFGGSARHPFFLRKPYRFRAGHTIVVRIQNLQASANNVQVVISGVIDE